MGVYKGDIYYGAGKTNCLTYVPKNVNLELDKLNATVVGSPTITNGVASGFSTSNYLRLPSIFNPSSASNWEMVFKFKITSAYDTWLNIFGNGDSTDRTSGVHIFYSSNKIRLECCTLGASTWDICNLTGTTLMELNTDYWVKVEFTGSAYNCYLSTDGSTFNLETSSSSTSKIGATVIQCIGNSLSHSDKYHLGSIDLSQSYIKTNGSVWWKGGTGNLTLKADSKVYIPNGWDIGQVGIYGSPTIKDGVASGFSTSNYLSISKGEIISSLSSLEFLTRVKINEGFTIDSPIICKSDAIQDLFVEKSTNVLCIYDGSTKFSGSTVLSSSNWYWVKVVLSNDVYTAYLLQDVNYTVDTLPDLNDWSLEFTTTSNIWTGSVLNIGRGILTGNQYFSGSIDLSESYIKINDEIWWQGKKGNGERVFEEKVIEEDKTLHYTWQPSSAIQCMLFINPDGSFSQTTEIGALVSGSTAPTTAWTVWYDTTNNIMKRTGSSASIIELSGFSLPVGIITQGSNGVTQSINQTFDWIGYIGGTSFVLPGVKGLISNEFNPNGTYKNIEFEVDKVLINTRPWSTKWSINQQGLDAVYYKNYAEQAIQPTFTNGIWLNTKENVIYKISNSAIEGVVQNVYAFDMVAQDTTEPYSITSLTPRAVQTNNTARKIGDVYFCPGKTNCLTSFPKNINWSLTDGILTLKKGSKVYIPNGWTEYTYYKCTTTSWTQPTLSADGTVGGTSYACRCKAYLTNYPAYKAFDSDKTATIWASTTNAVDNWIEFYSPVELIVSKVSVTNRKEDIPGTFGTVTLQGSLNGTDYFDLARYTNTNSSVSATWSFNTSVQRPAKYLRLYANSQYGSNDDIVVANISFTAQQVTATVESTADNYTYVIGSGKRVFDEVVIDGDKTFNNTGGTGIYPMFYDKYNNTIHSAVPTMGSGTATPTASTSYQLFYNVSENIIYFDGGSWLGGYSLPLGRINATDTVPTSISQHFSWFGFIGSTAFTLPNIEGLCSNGFNTDGTYKNVRGYEDEVQIHTYGSNWTRAKQPIFLRNGSIDFSQVNNDGYHEGTDRSAYDSLTYQCFYNTKENKTYYSGSTAGQWEQQYKTLLGYINMTSGVISSITHIGAKTTNDLKRVKETYNGSTLVRGYISNTTLFEKSTAGTYTVTIPYNGYYQLWLVGAGGGGSYNSSGNKGSSAAGNSGGYVNVKAYLKKGSYSVTVGAGGAAWGGTDYTGWGKNGGSTSITFGGKTLLLAGGGTANYISYPSGYQQNSTISVANQINSSNFTLTQTVANQGGNAGGLGGNGSSPTGGASRYGGYGKGGNVYNRNSADAGGDGYVKVVAITINK